MDAKESGQMGLATVLYYLTTTILATLLGITLVMTIHPGDPSIKGEELADVADTDVSPLDTFLDLVRNMFPENIIQATFERVQTKYVAHRPHISKNASDDVFIMKKTISPTRGMNIL
ncbi:hypothetical protein COOONC_20664, partial [Cooperia oncophora]